MKSFPSEIDETRKLFLVQTSRERKKRKKKRKEKEKRKRKEEKTRLSSGGAVSPREE